MTTKKAESLNFIQGKNAYQESVVKVVRFGAGEVLDNMILSVDTEGEWDWLGGQE